jgi:hypothetical protein
MLETERHLMNFESKGLRYSGVVYSVFCKVEYCNRITPVYHVLLLIRSILEAILSVMDP